MQAKKEKHDKYIADFHAFLLYLKAHERAPYMWRIKI